MSKFWWMLIGGFFGTSALGAEVALVGVHDESITEEAQLELMAAAKGAIELLRRHDPVMPEAFVQELKGRERLVLQQSLQSEGLELLEDGQLFYQQAQPEIAVTVLEKAAQSLEEGVKYTNDVSKLWEAYMRLATVRSALDDQVGTRDALMYAVALQPRRVPDGATFPPQIVEMYASEQEMAFDEVGLVDVKIEGDLKGQVFVDGELIGDAPVEDVSLVAGAHHLVVQSKDGRMGYLRVDVESSSEESYVLAAEPPRLGEPRQASGGRAQQVRRLYQALQRNSGVDLILVAGTSEEGPTVQLYAGAEDAFSEAVSLDGGFSPETLSAAIPELMQAVDRQGVLRPEAVVDDAAPIFIDTNDLLSSLLLLRENAALPALMARYEAKYAPPPTKKMWPVYVGIGAGVAVVTATVLAVVLGGGGEPVTSAEGVISVNPVQQ